MCNYALRPGTAPDPARFRPAPASEESTLRPSRRRLRCTLAVAVLAPALLAPVGLVAPAVALPPSAPACAEAAGRGWTSVPAPDLSAYANVSFRDGDQLIAHALDPRSPGEHWVASSAAVLRSRDGGCSWEEAVALPEVPTAEIPYTRALHRIEQVLAGRTVEGAQRVLAVGRAFPDELLLLGSDEGGAPGTWQPHRSPQISGNLSAVEMAPSNADRVYAAFDRALVALLEVHVSDDGGRTWQLVSSIDLSGQRALGPTGDAVLAVDPGDPDTVLLSAGPSGVLRSTDGGRTFSRSGGPRLGGGLVVRGDAVVGFEGFDGVAHVSRDGGTTWQETATGAPGGFRQAAYGLSTDVLLASLDSESDGASVWRWDPGARSFSDISPKGRPQVLGPVHDGAGGLVLHGPGGLWTWHGDRAADAGEASVDVDPRLGNPPLRPAAPPPPEPARLELPGSLALTIGEQREVTAQLTVPSRPRDLDLALLFDTTNSMTGSIDALRTDAQRLVDALAASGNRTRFGVAEFQDYPLPPHGQPSNRAYARLHDLAPAGPTLRTALAALSTRDDLDVPTSGLTGLFQVATGAGQSGLPRAPQSEDPNIGPGQGMSYAADAVKVVVAFGDEPFHDSPSHPGPSSAEVVAALRAAGVLAVGVSVGGRPAGAGADLRRVARGSGAMAPVDVDCGGSVVPAGEPLVCEVGDGSVRADPGAAGGDLVGAVSALVDAVPAPATAALEVTAPDGVTAAAGPAVAIDLRRRSTAAVPVTVGCDRAATGLLRVVARVGREVVARGSVPVTCGQLPPSAADPTGVLVAAPSADAPAGAVAAAPPAAPPPVVQVPAPAPAPAQAPAPGALAAPGAAAGTAAGLAGAPADPARSLSRAFTDDRSQLPLAAVPLAGGLLATAALTAQLLATRRRRAAPSLLWKDLR